MAAAPGGPLNAGRKLSGLHRPGANASGAWTDEPLAVPVVGREPPFPGYRDLYPSYGELFTDLPKIGNPVKTLYHHWRKFLAEFFGTMFLVYFGTGSAIIALGIFGIHSDVPIIIALGFGVAAITAIYATANLSGGHINPAVTIGLFAAGQISLSRGLFYIGSQIAGAIVGSVCKVFVSTYSEQALVMGSFPQEICESVDYAVTKLAKNAKWTSVGEASGSYSINVGQGVLMEIILTALLLFVILATVKVAKDPNNMGKLAPLAIGLAIMITHLVGASFTGPSINPARSLGPAIISGYWVNHWVYWVGPIVGAVLAALIYRYFFIQPARKKDRVPARGERFQDDRKISLESNHTRSPS